MLSNRIWPRINSWYEEKFKKINRPTMVCLHMLLDRSRYHKSPIRKRRRQKQQQKTTKLAKWMLRKRKEFWLFICVPILVWKFHRAKNKRTIICWQNISIEYLSYESRMHNSLFWSCCPPFSVDRNKNFHSFHDLIVIIIGVSIFFLRQLSFPFFSFLFSWVVFSRFSFFVYLLSHSRHLYRIYNYMVQKIDKK